MNANPQSDQFTYRMLNKQPSIQLSKIQIQAIIKKEKILSPNLTQEISHEINQGKLLSDESYQESISSSVSSSQFGEQSIDSDFEDPLFFDVSEHQFSSELLNQASEQDKKKRRIKQNQKIRHLQIYDWIMFVASKLKLLKTTYYQTINVLKRFLYFQHLLPNTKVDFTNIEIYGLASLLISSKFESIGGNFMQKILKLEIEGRQKINKAEILEAQIYILQVIGFKVFSNNQLTVKISQTLQDWNSSIKNTSLSYYQFCPQLLDTQTEKNKNANLISVLDNISQQKQKLIRLKTLLYFIDYVLLRKICNLKIKKMCELENKNFYYSIILNIIYHLIISEIQAKYYFQKRNTKLKQFKHFYLNFVMRLNPDITCKMQYFRKSFNLMRQILNFRTNCVFKNVFIQHSDTFIKNTQRLCTCTVPKGDAKIGDDINEEKENDEKTQNSSQSKVQKIKQKVCWNCLNSNYLFYNQVYMQSYFPIINQTKNDDL